MPNTKNAKSMKETILKRVGHIIDMADVVTGLEITISIGKEVIPTVSYKVEGFPIIPDYSDTRSERNTRRINNDL